MMLVVKENNKLKINLLHMVNMNGIDFMNDRNLFIVPAVDNILLAKTCL